MNKNIGPFLAFDKAWFAKHQRVLLWLANHWLTRRTFRWILRIRRTDVGHNGLIARLAPNHYTVIRRVVDAETVEVSTDFRTHNKYAKRVYFALRPVWWMLHVWDWLVADRLVPRLSFGFLTLTAYPDTGNPGAATVDGWSGQGFFENAAWSTIIAAAGNSSAGAADPDDVFQIRSAAGASQWNALIRSFYHFDTSALTGSASISAATFSLFGNYKDDPLAITPDVNVYQSTITSNTTIANTDLPNVGSTAFATAMSYASWSITAYNDFALNASGISNISLTGVSKFSARNANYDAAAVAPTWTASLTSDLGANFADHAGNTQDPKLVVTYTTGPGPILIDLMHVPGWQSLMMS